LKRQVQLDKEEATNEINKLAETILTRLNSLEKDFVKDCKSQDILDYYSKLIQRMKGELSDFEKCLKSLKNVDEDRKKKSNQIEKVISNLDKEIEEF
jgi:chaperonin cofactor prefoldin